VARRRECRACFENGYPEREHSASWCEAYDAQVAWNRRMARLLADTTPWQERPVVQAPDFSDPRPGMTPGARELREILEQNGRAYRLFRAAVEKAAVSTSAPKRTRKAA